jgi:hypothetical protein
MRQTIHPSYNFFSNTVTDINEDGMGWDAHERNGIYLYGDTE